MASHPADNPSELVITAVKVYTVRLPFVKPYVLSDKTRAGTDNIVLKVETNKEGIFGWGEADPLSLFTSESVEAIHKVYGKTIWPLLKGTNPLQINEVMALVEKHVSDANVMGKGALNMALWDIMGKYRNMPAYLCLVDGDKDKVFNKAIPLLYPFSDQTLEEDKQMLKEKIDAGYRTFMIKMGCNNDIPYQIKRMQGISDYMDELELPMGKETHFIPDCNQGMNFEQAKQFAEGCKHLDFYCFEQPLPKKNHLELKELQESMRWPLSLDESVQDAEDVTAMLEQKIGSVFSLKVSKNGGISRLFEMSKMLAKNGVATYFNSMLEYGITQAALLQVIAVTEGAPKIGHCFMSTLRFKDDITTFSDQITNAVVSLSDKPGLGIDVNLEKLEKYTVEKREYSLNLFVSKL